MNAEHARACQIARRLLEAIGYVELGKMERAKVCLAAVGRNAAFGPVAKMIRDEVSRRVERLSDDAVALEVLHRRAPEPVDQKIVVALTRCYQQAGEAERPAGMPSEARSAAARKRQGKPGKK
jgi:hypothetical protein